MSSLIPVSFAVILFASTVGAAPSEVTSAPFAIAPCVTQAPVIDGELGDPAWQSAPQLGPFGDLAGAPAKNETTARIVRTKDALFIAFTCGFAEGSELKAEQTQRDSDVWTDESVEVFIDPGVTLRKYRHFALNASNVQRDEAGDKTATPPFDASWDGGWQSGTSRGPAAWYAELAIPFADVGLKPGAPAIIGLNVCRNDQTAGDLTCWSAMMSGFHEPVRFGLVSLPARQPGVDVSLGVRRPRRPRLGPLDQEVTLTNHGPRAANVNGLVIVGNERGRAERAFEIPRLAPGLETEVRARCELTQSGQNGLVIAVRDASGNVVAAEKLVVALPAQHERDYGYRLAGGEELGLWWSESLYKVHRDDPLPSATSREVSLSAAGHEFEAAQIVFRPSRDTDISLSISDFKGPGGRISADNFTLLEVAYVPVWRPTDSFGWADEWPDPLPPLEGPLHCDRGDNQPVWLLAYVPPLTKPGQYRGTVTATADGVSASIPVSLRVHDFTLTPETHTRTAYGVSPAYGFMGVSDPDQRREVYDLYMQSCRDHRISPYSPMAHYPIKIETIAPMRRFNVGRMSIEFETGDRLWQLYWDGEELAHQRTSQTHFGGEGVGWEGTGLGWPYLQTIDSVTEVSRTESMTVLDVTGSHLGSGAAARSFRLTFRFYIPAGDNWFAHRLIKMEGTDEHEIEVRSYFNLPRTVFKAEEAANGSGYAAWSDGDVGFGMICLDGGVGGLGIAGGAEGVTVNNPVAPFRIKAGQTHEGWGPLVVYFVTDKTSPDALTARAQELLGRIDSENPASYAPTERVAIAEERRDDYTFAHDFSEFDEGATRYLDEFHLNGFNQSCMPGSIAGEKRFTDGYKRLHKLMYGPVIEHLREKGWLEKAYSYWYDEPNEEAYAHVREGMALLGENCPGLTRLLTEQPEKALIGPIDLWVPVLSMYRPEDCQARQAAGDRAWWYVCCGPGHPYPNNFVDHPAINHRIRFWMAEKYGVEGSLYWATTFYGQTPDREFRNPWQDAMTYRPSGGYWGNGDGMLLYPACREKSDTPVIEGPVVSIRWELLRDGIEDREYFWLLREEIARLEALRANAPKSTQRRIDKALKRANEALASPDRLAESLIVYTKDPQDLLRARQQLALAIETCRRID